MTPEQTITVFIERVRFLRDRQHLSVNALCRRAGLKQATLSDMLNHPGKYGPTLATVARIAAALGVPPAELLTEPACVVCYDAPPPGFTCNTCQTVGAP